MQVNRCILPPKKIFNKVSAPKLTNQRQSNYTRMQYQTYTLENLKANYLIGFNGYLGTTKCKKVQQDIDLRTHFFREPKTDKIVQEYIMENFAEDSDVQVVSGACSTGEEAKSYFMMLDGKLGERLHILGFDISNQAIKDANNSTVQVIIGKINKKGEYKTEGSLFNEAFLTQETSEGLNEYEKKCWENFHKYYEKSGEPIFITCGTDKKIYHIQNFEQKEAPKFKRCEFKTRSVEKLKGLCKQNSVNVLLYRNAIHYSLCEKEDRQSNRRLQLNAPQIMDDIACKMNWVVKMNGLVVFEETPQRGLDYSLVSTCMKKNGFEQLVRNGETIKNVWVKTEDIEEEKQKQKWEKYQHSYMPTTA